MEAAESIHSDSSSDYVLVEADDESVLPLSSGIASPMPSDDEFEPVEEVGSPLSSDGATAVLERPLWPDAPQDVPSWELHAANPSSGSSSSTPTAAEAGEAAHAAGLYPLMCHHGLPPQQEAPAVVTSAPHPPKLAPQPDGMDLTQQLTTPGDVITAASSVSSSLGDEASPAVAAEGPMEAEGSTAGTAAAVATGLALALVTDDIIGGAGADDITTSSSSTTTDSNMFQGTTTSADGPCPDSTTTTSASSAVTEVERSPANQDSSSSTTPSGLQPADTGCISSAAAALLRLLLGGSAPAPAAARVRQVAAWAGPVLVLLAAAAALLASEAFLARLLLRPSAAPLGVPPMCWNSSGLQGWPCGDDMLACGDGFLACGPGGMELARLLQEGPWGDLQQHQKGWDMEERISCNSPSSNSSARHPYRVLAHGRQQARQALPPSYLPVLPCYQLRLSALLPRTAAPKAAAGPAGVAADPAAGQCAAFDNATTAAAVAAAWEAAHGAVESGAGGFVAAAAAATPGACGSAGGAGVGRKIWANASAAALFQGQASERAAAGLPASDQLPPAVAQLLQDMVVQLQQQLWQLQVQQQQLWELQVQLQEQRSSWRRMWDDLLQAHMGELQQLADLTAGLQSSATAGLQSGATADVQSGATADGGSSATAGLQPSAESTMQQHKGRVTQPSSGVMGSGAAAANGTVAGAAGVQLLGEAVCQVLSVSPGAPASQGHQLHQQAAGFTTGLAAWQLHEPAAGVSNGLTAQQLHLGPAGPAMVGSPSSESNRTAESAGLAPPLHIAAAQRHAPRRPRQAATCRLHQQHKASTPLLPPSVVEGAPALPPAASMAHPNTSCMPPVRGAPASVGSGAAEGSFQQPSSAVVAAQLLLHPAAGALWQLRSPPAAALATPVPPRRPQLPPPPAAAFAALPAAETRYVLVERRGLVQGLVVPWEEEGAAAGGANSCSCCLAGARATPSSAATLVGGTLSCKLDTRRNRHPSCPVGDAALGGAGVGVGSAASSDVVQGGAASSPGCEAGKSSSPVAAGGGLQPPLLPPVYTAGGGHHWGLGSAQPTLGHLTLVHPRRLSPNSTKEVHQQQHQQQQHMLLRQQHAESAAHDDGSNMGPVVGSNAAGRPPYPAKHTAAASQRQQQQQQEPQQHSRPTAHRPTAPQQQPALHRHGFDAARNSSTGVPHPVGGQHAAPPPQQQRPTEGHGPAATQQRGGYRSSRSKSRTGPDAAPACGCLRVLAPWAPLLKAVSAADLARMASACGQQQRLLSRLARASRAASKRLHRYVHHLQKTMRTYGMSGDAWGLNLGPAGQQLLEADWPSAAADLERWMAPVCVAAHKLQLLHGKWHKRCRHCSILDAVAAGQPSGSAQFSLCDCASCCEWAQPLLQGLLRSKPHAAFILQHLGQQPGLKSPDLQGWWAHLQQQLPKHGVSRRYLAAVLRAWGRFMPGGMMGLQPLQELLQLLARLPAPPPGVWA